MGNPHPPPGACGRGLVSQTHATCQGMEDLRRDWGAPGQDPLPGKDLRPGPDVYKTEGAAKNDVKDGKPLVQCIHPKLLLEVGAVHTYGAQKYAMWNFTKGMEYSRFIGAALRHLLQWYAGEDLDKDTGRSHLVHAVASVNMLWACIEKGTGEDDRCRLT